MKYFANVNEANVVEMVTVLDDSFERNGSDFLVNTLKMPGNWIAVSQNPDIPGEFASVDDVYDPEEKKFFKPSPFPSWVLNKNTWLWEAPIAEPADGKPYDWNEETQTWDEIMGDTI